MTSKILIIGGSRGLGLSLVKRYATLFPPQNVYTTIRFHAEPGQLPQGVNVIEGVDVGEGDCGDKVVEGLKDHGVVSGDGGVGIVIYVAGVLKPEVSGVSNTLR
jgi:NAD(P)-dependent dehydrogenase (short-subunit alcohol dehydrogenase family)